MFNLNLKRVFILICMVMFCTVSVFATTYEKLGVDAGNTNTQSGFGVWSDGFEDFTQIDVENSAINEFFPPNIVVVDVEGNNLSNDLFLIEDTSIRHYRVNASAGKVTLIDIISNIADVDTPLTFHDLDDDGIKEMIFCGENSIDNYDYVFVQSFNGTVWSKVYNVTPNPNNGGGGAGNTICTPYAYTCLEKNDGRDVCCQVTNCNDPSCGSPVNSLASITCYDDTGIAQTNFLKGNDPDCFNDNVFNVANLCDGVVSQSYGFACDYLLGGKYRVPNCAQSNRINDTTTNFLVCPVMCGHSSGGVIGSFVLYDVETNKVKEDVWGTINPDGLYGAACRDPSAPFDLCRFSNPMLHDSNNDDVDDLFFVNTDKDTFDSTLHLIDVNADSEAFAPYETYTVDGFIHTDPFIANVFGDTQTAFRDDFCVLVAKDTDYFDDESDNITLACITNLLLNHGFSTTLDLTTIGDYDKYMSWNVIASNPINHLTGSNFGTKAGYTGSDIATKWGILTTSMVDYDGFTYDFELTGMFMFNTLAHGNGSTILADFDGDNRLDIIQQTENYMRIFLTQSATDTTNNPPYVKNAIPDVVGSMCVNRTQRFEISSPDYFDTEGDNIQLRVDCNGNGTIDDYDPTNETYFTYGANFRYLDCTYNNTGTFTAQICARDLDNDYNAGCLPVTTTVLVASNCNVPDGVFQESNKVSKTSPDDLESTDTTQLKEPAQSIKETIENTLGAQSQDSKELYGLLIIAIIMLIFLAVGKEAGNIQGAFWMGLIVSLLFFLWGSINSYIKFFSGIYLVTLVLVIALLLAYGIFFRRGGGGE